AFEVTSGYSAAQGNHFLMGISLWKSNAVPIKLTNIVDRARSSKHSRAVVSRRRRATALFLRFFFAHSRWPECLLHSMGMPFACILCDVALRASRNQVLAKRHCWRAANKRGQANRLPGAVTAAAGHLRR